MKTLASFQDVYNQYIDEAYDDNRSPAVDEYKKERKRFNAFLYALGIQPCSFKLPLKEDDSYSIKNMLYSRFKFNDDGRDFLLNYFRNRTCALYKSIRRRKFSPEYLEDYQIMCQQLTSNMKDLGHDSNSIKNQEILFWKTLGKDCLLDFLPGFRNLRVTEYIKENYDSFNDTMLSDLILLNEKIVKDRQFFQDKWELCVQHMIAYRQNEAQSILQEPWVQELESSLSKFFTDSLKDESVKFKKFDYLANEECNAQAEHRLDMKTCDYIMQEDFLQIIEYCAACNMVEHRYNLDWEQIFEHCMKQTLSDMELRS